MPPLLDATLSRSPPVAVIDPAKSSLVWVECQSGGSLKGISEVNHPSSRRSKENLMRMVPRSPCLQSYSFTMSRSTYVCDTYVPFLPLMYGWLSSPHHLKSNFTPSQPQPHAHPALINATSVSAACHAQSFLSSNVCLYTVNFRYYFHPFMITIVSCLFLNKD